MRDLVAGLIALALALVALVLVGALRYHRWRRHTARTAAGALGRRIVAELPAGADLTLVTEDDDAFYYGDRRVDKDAIGAVRVLINGAPIAVTASTRQAWHPLPPSAFEDRPEGIAHDRWDVAIETTHGTTLVECGAIRERVSQELARAIYDAVAAAIRLRDAGNRRTTLRA